MSVIATALRFLSIVAPFSFYCHLALQYLIGAQRIDHCGRGRTGHSPVVNARQPQGILSCCSGSKVLFREGRGIQILTDLAVVWGTSFTADKWNSSQPCKCLHLIHTAFVPSLPGTQQNILCENISYSLRSPSRLANQMAAWLTSRGKDLRTRRAPT